MLSADITVFRQEPGQFDLDGWRLHMDLGFYGLEGEIINWRPSPRQRNRRGKGWVRKKKDK
jgi:hypothetical protein